MATPPAPKMGTGPTGPAKGPVNGWITGDLMSKAYGASAIYDNKKEFGFGWWFAYFWKEIGAKGRDENRLKEVLAAVFAHKFPADIATKTAAEMRAEGRKVATGFTALLPEPPDLAKRPAYYRDMLTKLLNVGFREMPTQHAFMVGPKEERLANKEFFTDRIEAAKQGGLARVAIAYRGETREFATVIKHNGALSRADLGLLNMNAPWHPFSDPVVAGKTYARGASGDNCLYTVLSVATDVSIPVGFPLIEDRNIYELNPLPKTETVRNLSRWGFKQYRESKMKTPLLLAKCAISGVPQPSGIFLASDSFVYAVKVKKAVYTQDFVEQQFAMPQDQCKERGVRDVKLKNFLGGARVRRIHLGPARMCGVVGFVQEVKYLVNGIWVPNPNLTEFAKYHFYGDTVAAKQALDMIARQFAGPGGNGVLVGEVDESMAPNPMPKISRIEQWDLSFDQFNSYKGATPGSKAPNLYFGDTA